MGILDFLAPWRAAEKAMDQVVSLPARPRIRVVEVARLVKVLNGHLQDRTRLVRSTRGQVMMGWGKYDPIQIERALRVLAEVVDLSALSYDNPSPDDEVPADIRPLLEQAAKAATDDW